MGEKEGLTPPDDYLLKLKALRARVEENASEIEAREADSRAAWSEFSDLVGKFGVPEETKFNVAAFSGSPAEPERNAAFIEYLRGIDEQIKAAAGETAAWLTLEVYDTSHPFNPGEKPETEERYTLHVGVLPHDARLLVSAHGKLSVPIESSVAIPVYGTYMLSEHPSLEDVLIPTIHHFSDISPGLERNPNLILSLFSKEVPYPVVFGNKAVEELFDKHKVEGFPQVADALEVLTFSIS